MDTIQLSESQLQEIIEQAVVKILTDKLSNDDDTLLEYYAANAKEYKIKVASKLPSIFHNLACICIFHKVHTYTLNHWKNQAKNLLNREFESILKGGNKSKLIDIAFEEAFGEEYKEINPKWFNSDILYYGDKEGNKKIVAPNNAQYYFDAYIQLLINTLEQLKLALVKEDLEIWYNAVEMFYISVIG